MDLNHKIRPWSLGIWNHAALFLEPRFILRTYLEAFWVGAGRTQLRRQSWEDEACPSWRHQMLVEGLQH